MCKLVRYCWARAPARLHARSSLRPLLFIISCYSAFAISKEGGKEAGLEAQSQPQPCAAVRKSGGGGERWGKEQAEAPFRNKGEKTKKKQKKNG